MKQFSAVLFVLLLVSFAHAQQTWQKTYGGTGNDYGFSVQQTTDGGYVVAGYTTSIRAGDPDVYLIKTNASGDTLWTRTYGGMAGNLGYSVQQTTDGGYIVAGYTNSFGNGIQFYLVKTNASGDTLWTRTYGDTSYDYGYSVRQTSDGGYIVAGYTWSSGNAYQVYLVKTNASGDTLWTRNYGGTDWDMGEAVQQTSDGGYIVVGYTYSFGNASQFYLIKTNATGDTLWTRTYGGTGYDEGYSVQQTSDTGYIIAGTTSSFGNASQVYLVKTNASGDTLWTKNYGGTGYDYGRSVQQTTDGGYIIAGYTNSFGVGSWDIYLIKTNAQGDTLWTRTYGGAGDDEGYSVQQTTDGGYIIAGFTNSFGDSTQVYLIKTDANGNVGVQDKAVSSPVSRLPFSIRPNPFISFATVPGHSSDRFALYDVSGRRVGVYKGDRIGEGLRAGVYFIRALEGKADLARIVKVR